MHAKPGPDPHLDRVRSGGRQVDDAGARGDVACDDLDVGPGRLELGDRLDRSVGVAVGDVEDERVDLGRDELFARSR